MKPKSHHLCILLISICVILLMAGCAGSKKLTVVSTARLLEDVGKAANRQPDLKLVQEGMPAYLMLIDGMVTAWPGNERLLMAASQGYASYASAFADQAEPDYTRGLYGKATGYALEALDERGFKDLRGASFDDFRAKLKRTDKADVPYLFWAAASWGNWIGLNQESMAAMVELPKVEMLMRRVLELDEAYYYGGPHIFMGIWYASRPKMAGGDLEFSREHFLRAIELGREEFLMARVYFAYHYARRALDRELFTTTLEEVLVTPADIQPHLTLINTAAKKRARDLLDDIEDHF